MINLSIADRLAARAARLRAATGEKRYTRSRMGRSIRDQMLDGGIVREDETPEAKRAIERAARPAEPEMELPPAFEAPARGVIVSKSTTEPAIAASCVDCGALLRNSRRAQMRCAECAADIR